MRRLFQIPPYRHLLLAYGLNELAWSVGTLALAVLVYQRTGSALGSAAFFLCSQIVPALLTPGVVSRVDQRDTRVLLVGLYLLEGILFGLLAWMTHQFVLPVVLVLVLFDGSVALVARSLARSATTEVLKPLNLLPEGNALTNLVFSGCYMAGPIVGAVVVAAGGTVAALVVNCGLFTAIALVLLVASGLPGAAPEPETGKRRLRAAVDFVRGDRALRKLIPLQMSGMVVFTITIPVEVVLAEHTLMAGPGGYGALMAGWGAGAVIGSAGYARWRRRPGRLLISLGAVSLGAGCVLMGSAPNIVVAVIGAGFGGIGNGAGLMATKTMVQQYTPSRWMAVVTSLSESGAQSAPGAGIVIGGLLAAVGSARLALVVGGISSLIYAVIAWRALSPTVLPPAPEPDGTHNGEPPISRHPVEARETLA
jgi:MFS family permease